MKVRQGFMRQGSGSGELGDVHLRTHAPALQEFGDMMARSIKKKIESRDGKCICACWYITLVVCVCVRACAYLHISVREGINTWGTDPRAQPLNSDLMQSRDLGVAILRQ